MSMTVLSMILDLVVMAALMGTIYFAMRLSKSLNNFRAHRNEMKTLIAELSRNINDAENAIHSLKATSNKAADNLDDVLHDSRRMAEELKMINESSDSIATRLENLASGARGASYVASQSYDDTQTEEYYDEPKAANTDSGPVEPPSFFIQDREYGDDEADDNDALISEAERELMQALQENKKSGGGRS